LLRPTAKECLKDPWFAKNFETCSVSILKRSKTTALSTRHVAPIENFEDGRTIYEMLKNHRNGAKFRKEVMKVLIN
jgi:calcium-dependent protein kinase